MATTTSATLSPADVDTIIRQAVDAAEREKSLLRVDTQGHHVTTREHIAVVDREGNLLKLHSMPDAWKGSLNIAIGKARTAVYFSSDENALSTRAIGELSQPGKPLWQIGNSNQDGPIGLIEFPGGLPIYRDGALVGGIGVSGDGVDQDETVAIAGVNGFEPNERIRADKVGHVPYWKK